MCLLAELFGLYPGIAWEFRQVLASNPKACWGDCHHYIFWNIAIVPAVSRKSTKVYFYIAEASLKVTLPSPRT